MMKEKKSKKRWIFTAVTILVIISICLIFWLLWLFHWRFEIKTDDAYVHGSIIPLHTVVSAPAVAIYYRESDFVEEGALLIELDASDAEAALQQASAHLAQAVRGYKELEEKVFQTKELLLIREKQLLQAEAHFAHRHHLSETGALAGEEISASHDALEIAKREFLIAESQLEAALAQIEGTTLETHPSVEQAKAAFVQAFLAKRRTKIYAPKSGYIGQRLVEPGEIVQPGQELMTLIPLSMIWVQANYKESKLKKMGIGQRVSLSSDLYGKGVEYQGVVRGIAAGTGGVFSFLPPQNATGNWIKVIQRVPVIIELDPQEIKDHPLLLGLSMHATVHIEEDVPLLAHESLPTNALSTAIYDEELPEALQLAQRIIERNVSCTLTPLSMKSRAWKRLHRLAEARLR